MRLTMANEIKRNSCCNKEILKDHNLYISRLDLLLLAGHEMKLAMLNWMVDQIKMVRVQGIQSN